MTNLERSQLAVLGQQVKVLRAQMDEALALISALTVERPSLRRAADQERLRDQHMDAWARRYDELNGAPEGPWDR